MALLASSPAPAGAKLICSPGAQNRNYCTRVLIVSIKIEIVQRRVIIIITVTDPHLTVTLLRDGRVVERVYNGDATGRLRLHIRTPKQKGRYVLHVVATTDGITRVSNTTVIVS